MTSKAGRFAAAAEALLGTPFKLHGRDPRSGLDCVGLVASALSQINDQVEVPKHYRLRQSSIARQIRFANRNGLQSVDTSQPEFKILRGDCLLVKPGPAQHHLMIASSQTAFIHAHAGLGKIVRQPAPLSWPLLRVWRLQRTDKET
jgi:cell wall-associated NlpC family hydrolase